MKLNRSIQNDSHSMGARMQMLIESLYPKYSAPTLTVVPLTTADMESLTDAERVDKFSNRGRNIVSLAKTSTGDKTAFDDWRGGKSLLQPEDRSITLFDWENVLGEKSGVSQPAASEIHEGSAPSTETYSS